MYLFKIAVRNLFRRRKRTFIISSILALAVINFLLIDSFMIGMMDSSFANVIDFERPHIEIARELFFNKLDNNRELPLEESFTVEEEMTERIKASDGFVALTSVLDFSASLIAGREEFPVLVRSIDETSFSQVFRNKEYLIAGEFVEAGDYGIVIGDRMAEFFDLEIGDYYTLRFQDRAGYFSTLEGEIKGIMSTPHPQMNLGTVIISRADALESLGFTEDKISQLMIRMESRDKAVTESNKLAQQLAGSAYGVRSYRDASEMLVSMEAWGYLETYFILALILLVGAIGIINSIVLSALERVAEIGMMKAMGLKEIQIVKIFLIEATGIGVIGGLVGCIISALINLPLVKYGFDLDIFWDAESMGLPISGRIYGVWNLQSFLLIFILVVLIAVFASIIPSYWAARKDPVDLIIILIFIFLATSCSVFSGFYYI